MRVGLRPPGGGPEQVWGRGGGGVGQPRPTPHPHQKIFLRDKNEIYQRGRKFEAEFKYTNFLLGLWAGGGVLLKQIARSAGGGRGGGWGPYQTNSGEQLITQTTGKSNPGEAGFSFPGGGGSIEPSSRTPPFPKKGSIDRSRKLLPSLTRRPWR